MRVSVRVYVCNTVFTVCAYLCVYVWVCTCGWVHVRAHVWVGVSAN